MLEDVVTPTGPYRLRLMCRSGAWQGPLADGSTIPGFITATFSAPVDSVSLDVINGTGAGSFTLTAFDAAHEPYRAAITALKPRFDLYERANRVNDHPWLADLLIWRANRSARILRRMEGVLEETGNPGNLVSLRGIARLFLPIR